MSRYIDADKLWNDRPQCPRGQSQEYDKGFWDCIFRFSELIRKHINNSTADVEEVRHGSWIDVSTNTLYRFKCSLCGKERLGKQTDYCCHCGAKMDGRREENEG